MSNSLRNLAVFAVAYAFCPAARADQPPLSHPALRTNPPRSTRPAATGPSRFVDASEGNDDFEGTQTAPWRTIAHAMAEVKPGETLYLREGVYYENIYLARAGRPDAPITIRAYPNEQAIIDGSIRQFQRTPNEAWEPVPDGAPGEFRSSERFPNLNTAVGSFGDSMIGLQTYYHQADLSSQQELVDWEDWDHQDTSDLKPLYCGPGLWYDQESGHIHVRLTHTHLPAPVANYRGPTDPRQMPLVIAPFRSMPLHLDHARHIRLQDIVIRGAGYTAVALDQTSDIEFDNVTIWCGTYGIRASGAQGLRIHRSGLYGSVAPWTFRGDGSKRDYPGRPHRNISRLNTHALVEIESGRESSVYATPQNDRWEIAYSEFTDAHDGLYLGSINVRFHHNLVENLQDDGLYLSPMYLRHRLEKTDPEIHIAQNTFRGLLTAIAFGGTETQTRDGVYIYRNLFDLRAAVNTGRPTTRSAEPSFSSGKLMGDHGSPPWPAMNIYHNTVVAREPARDVDMAATAASAESYPRRVFNNIFFHIPALPGLAPPNPDRNSVADGNLYWSAAANAVTSESLFGAFRASEQFARSKRMYDSGSTAHSLVGDPNFLQLVADAVTANDYRIAADSPAVNAGVELPAAWPDPLKKEDRDRPDIGALPQGAQPLRVGRTASE